MILVLFCSCLCPIYWSHVLSREWRCSWSSADRRCSNYIWVIDNLIVNKGASYIRDLTVVQRSKDASNVPNDGRNNHSHDNLRMLRTDHQQRGKERTTKHIRLSHKTSHISTQMHAIKDTPNETSTLQIEYMIKKQLILEATKSVILKEELSIKDTGITETESNIWRETLSKQTKNTMYVNKWPSWSNNIL